MNNKELNILSIISVIISVVCLTVAFASLSTTIRVSGTSFMKAASWNIAFQTPLNLTNSTGGRWIDNPVGGTVEGEPKIIGTTLYFNAELDERGDYVSFDIPVKNTGTIDAILSNVATSISGIDKDILILSVVDSNSNNLTSGSMTLNADETKTITVKAAFDPSALDIELPAADSDVTIEVTLLWEQK